jgi:hypothetical protein
MSSIWDDVRTDPVATEELVRQLVASASAVADALAVLDRDVPSITEDWTGPHRQVFDDELAHLRRRGAELVARLLAGASAAAALQAAADGEQRLRTRLRQQAMAEEACAPAVPC